MKRFISVLALALIVAGCATTPTPTPVVVVPTQAPTWTPQPTYTPNATYTPNPTLTPYPTPTFLPPTPTLAPTPTATPTPVTYVVQPGDWLTALAQQFDVSPEAIIAINNIQDPNHIEVGTVLTIPLTSTVPTTATVAITPTVRLVAVRPAAPPPPPSNYIYRVPQILYPDNGLTLKYNSKDKSGGTDSIIFAWLPVSANLETGKTPCSWPGQPNGTQAFLWDRYHIEFNPPLYNPKLNRILNVFHNDQGTNREFNLLEFNPGVSYSWRVAVGRWCVSNYDNQDPKHQGFLGLVSPYTEWRSFAWNP